MAQTRLHKVVHDLANEVDHFQHVVVEGDGLGKVNDVVDKVNSKWADIEEICIETHELTIADHPTEDVPHSLVLRGTARCCCGGPCPFAAEHDLSSGGAFSRAARGFVYAASQQGAGRPHAPGLEYVESVIDLLTLNPLRAEATQRVGVDEQRRAFAAEIQAEAALFELTPEDVERQLGVVGVDTHGLLSKAGAAAKVLAGEVEEADDYFWVAAFVILWQRLLTAVHTKMTTDWPQRNGIRSARFGT